MKRIALLVVATAVLAIGVLLLLLSRPTSQRIGGVGECYYQQRPLTICVRPGKSSGSVLVDIQTTTSHYYENLAVGQEARNDDSGTRLSFKLGSDGVVYLK